VKDEYTQGLVRIVIQLQEIGCNDGYYLITFSSETTG
jgi:hypothetical protein